MALDDQVQGLTLEADEGASGSGASDAGPVTSINFFEANKPDTHDNPLGALWDLQLPVLTRAYGLRVPASCVLYVPEAQGRPPPGRALLYVRVRGTSLGRAVAPQATSRVHAARGRARPDDRGPLRAALLRLRQRRLRLFPVQPGAQVWHAAHSCAGEPHDPRTGRHPQRRSRTRIMHCIRTDACDAPHSAPCILRALQPATSPPQTLRAPRTIPVLYRYSPPPHTLQVAAPVPVHWSPRPCALLPQVSVGGLNDPSACYVYLMPPPGAAPAPVSRPSLAERDARLAMPKTLPCTPKTRSPCMPHSPATRRAYPVRAVRAVRAKLAPCACQACAVCVQCTGAVHW